MPDWGGIIADLGRQGVAIDPDCVPTSVGGGDISAAWRLSGTPQVFVKTGGPEAADMFDAEAEGLAEIAASRTLRVPRVLASGCIETHAWLALEWLALDPTPGNAGARLGEGLAAMHRVTQELHGWHRDNTIGSTPQTNLQCADWCEFFRERRLRPQFALAAANGFGGRLQDEGLRLLDTLDRILAPHTPAPSLLHGDLWGGNTAVCDGEPVLFDPALYFGDRETDLAMTRLFGGFSRSFYAAYESAWPLPSGHENRLGLYQLYHVLNHLNLFGASYLSHAQRLVSDALVAIR